MKTQKSNPGERFRRWLDGETDVMESILDMDETPYLSRNSVKESVRNRKENIDGTGAATVISAAEKRGLSILYSAVAVISCVMLIGVLLFVLANLPRYGEENPRTTEVVERYVEKGVEETGAVNIVAGLILDYRAFDTLGESHVLFTALVCVMILLRKDKKNMSGVMDDYYTISKEHFHEISTETILRLVACLLVPCVFVYGIYVLLNGQNGPGGGFSGGAVMGAGFIMASASFGFDRVDRIITAKLSTFIAFAALSFYCFAKGYVFFTGANGLENHIPKGTPGAILSGGLILPLDIAVGIVVAFTMFGFYSLFRRGNIGGR